MTHVCCSIECAEEFGKLKRIKERARERARDRRERLKAIKSRAKWLKEAQSAVNAVIRERDKDLPCISCGTVDSAQWDAGHYRSRGACPELRFHPDNIHKQCCVCNHHQGGNVVSYRVALIRKVGLAQVEWLEGPHEPAKYTIPELEQIILSNRALLRAMRQRAG